VFSIAARKYGFTVLDPRASEMKTTIELPDDLYRKAKAIAALNGRKLKDLVEEGLRLVIESPGRHEQRRDLAALMKRARGIVDSGKS
jgi:hypothetical protein